MLEGTEEAGEIQSVERPLSQEEKNGAATVGRNEHTDRKETKKNFLWSTMTRTRLGGCTGLKIKPDKKMSAGSVSAQGRKMGAAAKTVQKQQKTVQQKWRNKKTNVF
jgi:hypothetical protein